MAENFSRFKRVFSNRAFTGALLFVTFLYSFEETLFDFQQFRFFQLTMTFRPFDEKLVAVLSGIASLGIFFWFTWVSLKLPRNIQIIPVILLTVSSLVEYGFWKAVKRFMSDVDLHIAFSTPYSTWTGAGALYFDWRFIFPVAGFVIVLFVFWEKERTTHNGRRAWGLFLFLAALCFSYTLTGKSLSLGTSVSSFYQTIPRFIFNELRPSARADVGFQQSVASQNNIVLVIDESIRGDHLSVNGYARATTPVLDELLRHSDSIRNWGLAVAGATCSYPSNALILTGVRPGVDEFGMVETHPTVFQYAKAMGYETVYMDAQTNTFWNGLTPDDLEYIDVWIKAKDLGDDIQSDFRAADWIVERTMNDTGNFIVLNKRGVHFLYENSYPADFELWGPVPGEYTSQPELVTNPYDNGVMYNVNAFFERLLADPQILTDTTILYTSDHGQTLFENGVSWLHCNDTPMEATIPLLMLGRNLPASSDENFLASHSNIMPTLLDLMDVPDKFRVYPYAPSLFSPAFDAAGGRWFFDGSLRLIEFHSP